MIVLAVLSLLIILVIGLISMTTTEQQASRAFSDTVDARALSELAVDLAIGQIRKATEENSPTKAPSSSTNFEQFRTWASQPGMIRVFGTEEDSSGFRAKPVAAYKLYSDDQLVWKEGVSGRPLPEELAADRSDLDGWNETPAVFADLNEPARVVLNAESGESRPIYPIIDPAAYQPGNSSKGIQGFSFEMSNKGLGTSAEALPMPVRWIYVLQDGQLTTPAGGSGKVADFAGSKVVPTEENPIVGRIAFWTDDESCKININTASEGDYWDTPRANNATDNKYARRVPAKGEFNRFPGHPALTCLSPVYRAFDEKLDMPPDLTETERRKRMRIYAALSPHVGWGGTQGGTADTSNTGSTSHPIKAKRTRLYATVDELFFSPDRVPHQDDPQTDVDFDNEDFQIGKAFLTAHSKAPELNLFNKPKISLWPQSRNTNERNAVDRLIAFCNRAGRRQWEFDRSSNYKNQSNPGSAMATYADWSGRNTAMLDSYLPYLTGEPIGGRRYEFPGFGSSMYEKYGKRKTIQIITSSFDLVHWGVNSYSTGLGKDYVALPARGGISGTSNPGLIGETSALGFRWRTENISAKAFGRFPTITEAAIVFMATDAEKDKDDKYIDTDNDGFADHTTEMRAFWILEPFSPTVGPPSWTANVTYRLADLTPDSHGIENADGSVKTSLKWTNQPELKANYPNGWCGGGHTMPFVGMLSMLMRADQSGNNGQRRNVGSRKNKVTEYTFASGEVDVEEFFEPEQTETPFRYKGGHLTIETRLGYNDGVVQRLDMEFPATTLTLPQIYIRDATNGNENGRFNDLEKRLHVGNINDIREVLIRPGDRVRSVLASSDPSSPARGDLRFIAGLYSVAKNYFSPHPDYHNANIPCAHGLRHSRWRHECTFGWTNVDRSVPWSEYTSFPAPGFYQFSPREVSGSLVEDMVYARDCWPSVSTGLNGAYKNDGRPGDWDTGVGRIEDGPYINKPDEGNTRTGYDVYMNFGSFAIEDGESFSPNRQICSAVAFGSLPTGIDSVGVDPMTPKEVTDPAHFNRQEPWQTLLFCPNPPSRTTRALDEPDETDHRGFGHPRDHLYLENYWMPIVEPYAISEPAATAGKINMNFQMIPFTYIDRSTGIYAAMKSTKLMAITPLSVGMHNAEAGYNRVGGKNYKEWTVHDKELRYNVNVDATLAGFRHRFDQGDIFRSASEICEIFLVPERIPGGSYNADAKSPPDRYEDMVEWWNGDLGDITKVDAFELTGDNLREAPYNQIYPRLTTKSNVFHVHFRVQVLRSAHGRPPDKWDQDYGSVTAEFRGSTLVERYLDPNEASNTIGFTDEFDNYGAGVGSGDWWHGWDRYYRFRIIRRHQFAP